jgi:hypothetical protein
VSETAQNPTERQEMSQDLLALLHTYLLLDFVIGLVDIYRRVSIPFPEPQERMAVTLYLNTRPVSAIGVVAPAARITLTAIVHRINAPCGISERK